MLLNSGVAGRHTKWSKLESTAAASLSYAVFSTTRDPSKLKSLEALNIGS